MRGSVFTGTGAGARGASQGPLRNAFIRSLQGAGGQVRGGMSAGGEELFTLDVRPLDSSPWQSPAGEAKRLREYDQSQ